MKNAILFILLSVPTLTFGLEAGTYQVVEGNNESICPQLVTPILQEGELVAIKVVYVGDCYYSGPFEYACYDQECKDGDIVFQIDGERSYRWLNHSYDIYGRFQRTAD